MFPHMQNSLSMTMPITCAISYLITYVPIEPSSKELSLNYKMKNKNSTQKFSKGFTKMLNAHFMSYKHDGSDVLPSTTM